MSSRHRSIMWNYFTRYGDDFQAICKFCKSSFSYKTTTANLRCHLTRRHPFVLLDSSSTKKTKRSSSGSKKDDDDDDDSISSVKFSSEIWAQFEQVDDEARCTICHKSLENTVEDMRSHLEEDHPAVLINILRKEAGSEDEQQEEALDQENTEDTYTEVVYLEEEPVKRATPKENPLKRRRTIRPHSERPHNEPTKLALNDKTHEANNLETDHIEPFLNYIKVLLKNVPKETFPKLQLDVISMILNAQINASQTAVQTLVPVTSIELQTPTPQVMSKYLKSVPSKGMTVTEDDINSDANAIATDYKITIENKDNDTS